MLVQPCGQRRNILCNTKGKNEESSSWIKFLWEVIRNSSTASIYIIILYVSYRYMNSYKNICHEQRQTYLENIYLSPNYSSSDPMPQMVRYRSLIIPGYFFHLDNCWQTERRILYKKCHDERECSKNYKLSIKIQNNSLRILILIDQSRFV